MAYGPVSEPPLLAGRRWKLETAITLSVCTSIGIIAAIYAGFQFRGSFSHGLIVVMIVLACVAVLLLSLIGYAGVFIKRRMDWLRSTNAIAGVLAVLTLQVPGFMLGSILLDRDIQDAKIFCEDLILPLDQYHQEYGQYPTDLMKILPTDTTIPYILRDNFYNSDGDTFNFYFVDPGGMLNGYEYFSTDRVWHKWD